MLGGGLVSGGVMLLGGDPGIGKSTLLLQAMAALGAARERALYVTGEESAEQVALRAQRLGLVNAPVELLAEVQLRGDRRRDPARCSPKSSSSTRSRPSTPRRWSPRRAASRRCANAPRS